MDYVWAFYYNSNTWESAPSVISLHKTVVGAYKAMRKHRLDHWHRERYYFQRYGRKLVERGTKDDVYKAWFVAKLEIKG